MLVAFTTIGANRCDNGTPASTHVAVTELKAHSPNRLIPADFLTALSAMRCAFLCATDGLPAGIGHGASAFLTSGLARRTVTKLTTPSALMVSCHSCGSMTSVCTICRQ